MAEVQNLKEIHLQGTKKGVISVGTIENPYGKGSGTVASIAITLDGNTDNVDWKVHIPVENIDEVVAALQALK